jgi:hypothetical protein
MKKLILLFTLVFSVNCFAVSTKKVCHEKNGKQVCKIIKVHKKLDGTKVPDAPKKKKK